MASMLFVIFNLFILEVLLSIDNAAVLAIMVKDLPHNQQSKALRYGILGAFLFRSLSLFAVSLLIKIWFLKIAGGAYLLFLVYRFFRSKDGNAGSDQKSHSVGFLSKHIGHLWATVVLVEVMDFSFSIDNIFAAAAMTDNIYLILAGVFIGIFAMRFVALQFTILMARFPSLEKSAFIVIGLLGVKLIGISIVQRFPSIDFMGGYLQSHSFDLLFSASLMIVFFFPLLTSKKHQHAIQ